MPVIIHDYNSYLNTMITKLQAISLNIPNAIIQIYTEILKHPYGYKVKTSTRNYPLINAQQCLTDFIGRFEQYSGDDSTIIFYKSIKISNIDSSIIEEIKSIENEINQSFVKLNPAITLELTSIINNITHININTENIENTNDKINYIIQDNVSQSPQAQVNDVEQEINSEYKWINNITTTKHREKALLIYNRYIDNENNKSSNTYALIRNKLRNSLNYYNKKYNIT